MTTFIRLLDVAVAEKDSALRTVIGELANDDASTRVFEPEPKSQVHS